MKNKMLLALFLLLPGFLFADLISGSISIPKEDLSYGRNGNYDTVTYPETKRVISTSSNPGEPALPRMYFKILVPEDAVFDSIEISNVNVQLAKNDFNCMPMQKPYVDIPGPFIPQNQSVYQTRRLYPYSDKVRFVDEGITRGYKVFTFGINFLELNPIEKKLYITEGFDYILNYTRDSSRATRATTPTHSAFAEIVSAEVENPIDQASFYGVPRNEINRSENIDFLIITEDEYRDTYNMYGEERKKRTRLSYKVITLQDVSRQYKSLSYQMGIKKTIKYYIDNYNTSYVYLANIKIHLDFPYKKCFVNGSFLEDKYDVPTDLFYACMDRQFDWNAVKNHEVGNYDDDVDLYPDVFIGRGHGGASPDSIALDLRKIEQYSNFSAIDEDFTKKYIIGSMNLWQKGDSTKHSNFVFNQTIKNRVLNHDTTILTEDGDIPLHKSSLRSAMEKGYNLMYMSAHSDGKKWDLEDNTSSEGKVHYKHIPGIVVSEGCYSGDFRVSRSLANELTDPRCSSAIAYLGPANVGLFMIDDLLTSQTLKYTREFMRQLNGGILYFPTLGKALAKAKNRYAFECKDNDPYSTSVRSQHYLMNLVGDPTIEFMNKRNYSYTGIQRNGLYNAEEIIPFDSNTAYMIGKNNGNIYKYNKGAWSPMPGWPKAIDLDIDEDGNLWRLTESGELYYGDANGKWKLMYSPGQNGIKVTDITALYKKDQFNKNNIYGVDRTRKIYQFWGNRWIHIASLPQFEKAIKIVHKVAGKAYILERSGYLYSIVNGKLVDISGDFFKIVDVSSNETDLMITGRKFSGMHQNGLYRYQPTTLHKKWTFAGVYADRVTFDSKGNPWLITNDGEKDDDRVFMGFPSFELLKNTNFTPNSKFSDWDLKLSNNGRGFTKYEDNNKQARVYVTNPMGVDSVSLRQDGVRLESHFKYRVTFDLSGTYDELDKVKVKVLGKYGWDMLNKTLIHEQKTQKFEVDFINTSMSDYYSLEICFGGISQIYTIDNISLRCIGFPDGSTVEEWKIPVRYEVGDIVEYNGKTWKNTYVHTSQVDWYPGAPGLWFWKEN